MNTDIRLIHANTTYNKISSGLPKPVVEAAYEKNDTHEKASQAITKSLHYYSSSQTTSQSKDTAITSVHNTSYRFINSATFTNNIIHKELQSKLTAFDSSNNIPGINRGLQHIDAAQFSPPSPEEVSNTVLGFIENKIKSEAVQGASVERIESLISQARSGFEKGFGQAKEQIEQLGLLSDGLSEEIAESYNSVHQGLEKIQTAYTREPGSRPIDDTQVRPSESKFIAPERPKFVFPSEQQTATSAYQHSYAHSESTSVQIRTQDGDIISINLSQLYASLKEGSQSSSSTTNQSSYDFQGTFRSTQYQYSIEGDLDEGETQALTDLLLQIESLAEEFFSGDFQGAFESALALGFDGNEIASFSVNLNMTQIEQISTYERISNITPQHDDASSPLSLLSNFSEHVTNLNEKLLEQFTHSEHMITDLLSHMVDDLFDSNVEDNMDANSTDNNFSPIADNLKSYLTQLLDII